MTFIQPQKFFKPTCILGFQVYMFIFILEKSAPITQINKTVSFEHNEEHYIIYNCDDLAQFG